MCVGPINEDSLVGPQLLGGIVGGRDIGRRNKVVVADVVAKEE